MRIPISLICGRRRHKITRLMSAESGAVRLRWHILALAALAAPSNACAQFEPLHLLPRPGSQPSALLAGVDGGAAAGSGGPAQPGCAVQGAEAGAQEAAAAASATPEAPVDEIAGGADGEELLILPNEPKPSERRPALHIEPPCMHRLTLMRSHAPSWHGFGLAKADGPLNGHLSALYRQQCTYVSSTLRHVC